MPETTVGYNPNCGYNAAGGASGQGQLITAPTTVNGQNVLPAYVCSSYNSLPGPFGSVTSLMGQLNFNPLPVAWMSYVLTGLITAATPANPLASNPVLKNGQMNTFNGATFGNTVLNSPWIPVKIGGVAIPAWSFEPTENSLLQPSNGNTSIYSTVPVGSYERVISYNRFSLYDYTLTTNAEAANVNQAYIYNLLNRVYALENAKKAPSPPPPKAGRRAMA